MPFRILALCVLVLTVGCTGKKEEKGKTFVFCSEGSPSAMNPQIVTDGTSLDVTHAMYSRLVEFKYGTTEVIPSLATSWESSADGLEFTFKLAKGVKFHTTEYFTPTRDFNADDVLFSFNRQRLKDHSYNAVSGGSYEYFDSMEMGVLIKDIVKVDDHTVKFILNRPEAPFIANLGMDFASILSKEYADKLEKEGKKEQLDIMPIGTGAFKYVRYAKDTMVRMDKNTEYFGTPAKIDQLVYAITPDASVRYQKLKAGECNLITYPAPADLEEMRKDPKVKMMEKPGFNVGYLAMNVEKKPWDNKLVRQAVNHALNRESYISAVYLGSAEVAKNPLPPTIWGYNKNIKDYDYNPTKAKELLAKAGFANGLTAELWVLPVARPYNPSGKKLGELMQNDLKQVGINVKLVTYDWPTYLEKSKNGEHEMLQMGWTGDNGDPDNFLNVLLGCSAVEPGGNRARWCNKEFNDLIVKAKQITDQKQRVSLYEKAQEIFKEEAPWATIAHSTVHRAMHKNVEGYEIDPLGRNIFDFVELK
jgi:dipeptide transport system substrate-binding protein